MSDETDIPADGTVDAASEGAEPASGSVDAGSIDAEVVDAEVVDGEVVDGEANTPGTPPDASTDREAGSTGAGPDRVDEISRERDEYLDALRQLQADFENYRKQALRRQGEAREHATGRLVEELLTVLDACDAGIEHGDDGVTAIFTSLLGVLEKAGLERLDPLNEPFDPNAHEAVMHEPDGEGAEGPMVVDVLRPGYRWKERTLRAAMVKVRG